MDLIRTHGLSERVIHFSAPSTEELSSVYHFAAVFCYPTLYEGFGIPLLEAFACGCPVAASSTSSLPEVAGWAAEFFDPLSVDSIAAAVERVVLSPSRSRELIAEGSDRLRSFSWSDSALKTIQVYRDSL
jgi:glycosyltransferase involved in cell wall biosynthesis